jgi:hypothetical protein
VTTNFVDGQAEVYRFQRPWRTVENCSAVTGFPPQLTLLQQLESEVTSVLIVMARHIQSAAL